MSISDIPTTTVNFQADSFNDDPYSPLVDLRAKGPLVYHETLQQYLVTGYDDCARILGNAVNFGQPTEAFRSLFGGDTISSLDRPRHAEVRSVWASHFATPSLRQQTELISAVVEGRVTAFLDHLRTHQVVDAVSHMTRAIPTLIIANLLGIPRTDHEMFSAWSDQMIGVAEGVVDPSPRGQELARRGAIATRELNQYLEAIIESGKFRTNDTMIGAMVASAQSGLVTRQEIVASITQLVFAGNETTAKLMAVTLYALSENPLQREKIADDRKLVPQAIDEVNRWMSVAQVGWRTTRNSASIGGREVPDGSAVLLLQGLANRDPNRWQDPDVFDINRSKRSHLGFGMGIHMCLGMHLAKREVEVWLNRFLDEVPDWDIVSIDWGRGWSARGPVKLSLSRPGL